MNKGLCINKPDWVEYIGPLSFDDLHELALEWGGRWVVRRLKGSGKAVLCDGSLAKFGEGSFIVKTYYGGEGDDSRWHWREVRPEVFKRRFVVKGDTK